MAVYLATSGCKSVNLAIKTIKTTKNKNTTYIFQATLGKRWYFCYQLSVIKHFAIHSIADLQNFSRGVQYILYQLV